MSKNSHSTSKLRSNCQTKQTQDSNKPQPPSINIYGSLKQIRLSCQVDWRLQKQQSKLSAVYRNITMLDLVPNVAVLNIKCLYLSNNYISDIENIQQFQNLQSLSLSYNQISRLSMLRYLGSLNKLEILALEGNPISKSKLYPLYAVGVTLKALNFRILDNKSLLLGFKNECMKNWNVYEENINQLFINYIGLIKIVQFGRRESINRVIKEAGKRANVKLTHKQKYAKENQDSLWIGTSENKDQKYIQRQRIQKCISICLSKVQFQVQKMSAQSLIKLQQNFLEDITKICAHISNPQSQNCSLNQSPYLKSAKVSQKQEPPSLHLDGNPQKQPNIQQTICAMYKLQQKQKQKMEELTEKIRNSCTKQRKQEQIEIQMVQQIIVNTYIGSKEEVLYYKWKTLEKVFNKLRNYVLKKKKQRFAANIIQGILHQSLIDDFRIAFHQIKLFNHSKKIQKACTLLFQFANKKQKNYFSCLKMRLSKTEGILKKKGLKEQEINTKYIDYGIFKSIQVNNNQFLFAHQQNESSAQIERKVKEMLDLKTNKTLLRKCFSQWSKLKILTKLREECWSLKHRLIQSQQRESKLANKVCLLQKLLSATEEKLAMGQQQHIEPKQLLEQLEKDCSSLKIKNIMNSRGSQDSPVSRKNLYQKQKQNIVKPNSSAHLFAQRKFNSSKKVLRISQH